MNILIVKPSSLGDIVHALPAVHLVRQHYPDALIAWVVNEQFASLLSLYSGVDEVIPFRRRRWGKVRHWHELAAFIGELRQHHFDLALDLQGLFRSGFISFASGAARRVGFQNAREGAGWFYTERIPLPANLRHAVDRNVFLVQAALGIAVTATMPDLVQPHDSVKEARRLLRLHDLSGHGPVLAVAPGARWPSKRWPPRFMAGVIEETRRRVPDLRCWVLGTPDEAADAAAVCDACSGMRPVSLVGQTDLATLVELLRRSDAVLTNDSGPMHLAAVLQVPVVALFGATDPELTGPYGDRHAVFRTLCERHPCFSRECLSDSRGCADGVPVSQVAEALASRLVQSRARRQDTTVTRVDEE